MKVIDKVLNKTKRGIYDSHIKLKPAKKYDDLTIEEINDLSYKYIGARVPVLVLKDSEKGVYIIGLHIGKRKPNFEELQVTTENVFNNAIRRMKKDGVLHALGV